MSIVWPLGQGQPSVAALERVAAPEVEPVTFVEAKSQAKIEHNVDDALVASLVSAAVDLFDADGQLGRAIITQTWAQWGPQTPSRVRLLMGPFQSLEAVQYYDADGVLQAADVADFETRKAGDFVTVEPKPGAAWPRTQARQDAIKITYKAGFGDAAADVPEGIRHAILLLVAYWYENRMAATSLNLRDAPMAVEALIGRHRVGWYG